MQIESDVLAPRAPRCTRWPAIDASAGHGEDESSIMLRIARADRVPAQVVGWLDFFGLDRVWLNRVWPDRVWLDRVGVCHRHGAGYGLNGYRIVRQGRPRRGC